MMFEPEARNDSQAVDATPDDMEERTEEYKRPRKSGCCLGGCLATVASMMLIIFLLLFLPVSLQKKGLDKSPPTRAPTPPEGRGYVGTAYYEPVRAIKTIRSVAGVGPSSKGAFVIMRFKVKNVGAQARMFDESMVVLLDEGKREYMVDTDLTDRYYNSAGRKSPWGKSLRAGQTKTVDALFNVERSASHFQLEVHDFDWRTTIKERLEIKNVKTD